MGYFSEQSIIEEIEFEDRSYSSFDKQLLSRLDDLKDRYTELVKLDAPCFGDDYYTKDDYRYAPVEWFETLADVARAIEIIKADFDCACSIITDEQNDDFEDEIGDMIEIEQLRLFNEYDAYTTILEVAA